jgi:hypothetical protein
MHAARQKDCPPETLAKFAKDDFQWVRVDVAENLNCPPRILKKLASDKSVHVRSSVAANPNCPSEDFQKLLMSTNLKVIRGVARSPQCPAEKLEKLASHRDNLIRQEVAANSKTPTKIRSALFEQLAEHRLYRIRGFVAKHRAAPVSALAILARDRESFIRSATASNRKCPSELLEELSTDRTTEVRRRVAENENCPRIALERLLKDRSWPVVHTAISNRECPRNLRKNAIQRIAEKSSIGVRKGAAKEWGNKFLRSRNLVEALAADESPMVRKVLAGNPRCPSHHYEALLDDDNDSVRLAAALNTNNAVNVSLIRKKPASNPWLLAKLDKAEDDFPGITAAVQEGNMLFPAPKTGKALRSTSLLGRIIALSQPDTPPGELARASGYRDWRQRMAIARNPATPPKILEKLSEDSNRNVAAQASATLRRGQ